MCKSNEEKTHLYIKIEFGEQEMEHLHIFIIDLALITIVAGIIALIFKKLKFPLILGYIAAGFILSPNFHVFPTVLSLENVSLWGEIGILFLMFAIGLKFSFKKIADVGTSAFVTATTVMTTMTLVGFLLGQLLGFGMMDSIFLGCMMSISSTMVIMKSYDEYNLNNQKFASLIMGTMIVEDIIAIFMMIVLSAISLGQNISGVELVSQIVVLLAMLVIWLLIGIYLIPTLLNKTKHFMNDEVLLMVSLGICFGMVMIAHFIGYSVALGAFIGGSILGGTLLADKINKLFSPIRDLFVAIFFVSVGMLIDPLILKEYLGEIIAIAVTVIIGQLIFATIGILLSGRGLHTAIRGGFSMVQIGEFSFVIATMGVSLGVISENIYPIIVCVSVITIFTTPIFMKNSERVYEKISKLLPEKTISFLKNFTTEKKDTSNIDPDWKGYIRLYLIRTGVVVITLFTTYYLVDTRAVPYLDSNYPDYYIRIIVGIVVLLFIIPIIGIMGTKRSSYLTKLWIKNKYNRLPIVALRAIRIIISILLVSAIFNSLLSISFFVLMPIAAAIIIFTIRSDFLKGKSIKMEARFISNFNEKLLAKWKADHKEDKGKVWLDEKLYVSSFKICEDNMKEMNVTNIFNKKLFDIFPVKIIRGDKHIGVPDKDERLIPGDIVHIAGKIEILEASIMVVEQSTHIEMTFEKPVTIKEYMYQEIFDKIPSKDQVVCVAIYVYSDVPFIKKSIKNSSIKKKYHGSVVGIEKGGTLPIITPNINTILEEGDIVWLMGNEKMVNKLLKDDMMDEM